MIINLFYSKGLVGLALLATFFTACGTRIDQATPTPPGSETGTAALTGLPSATTSAPTLTPTEEALAARVNGQGISLADFEAELALYQMATGVEPTPEERQRVLGSLIDQTLLVQAASEKGYTVDEAVLQGRLDGLASSLGGEAALAQWIGDHGYHEQSFRKALAGAVAATWMRDQITAAVPKTVEQVHARQILVYDSKAADEIYALLEAGNDFGNLAEQYDPVTGGDLGWFPRSYLLDAGLEAAAFDLQPGQYSTVIQTVAGFHILQVTERALLHPLTPEALLILQSQAMQDWLKERRLQSEIDILLT